MLAGTLSDVFVRGIPGYKLIILSVKQRTVCGVAGRGTMGGVVTVSLGQRLSKDCSLTRVMRRILSEARMPLCFNINVICIIFLCVHFGFELDLNLTIDKYFHVLVVTYPTGFGLMIGFIAPLYNMSQFSIFAWTLWTSDFQLN